MLCKAASKSRRRELKRSRGWSADPARLGCGQKRRRRLATRAASRLICGVEISRFGRAPRRDRGAVGTSVAVEWKSGQARSGKVRAFSPTAPKARGGRLRNNDENPCRLRDHL